MSFVGGPNTPDDIRDIKDIPLDHFWRKCMENLPRDWWLTLTAMPSEGGGEPLFLATAQLVDARHDSRPHYASQLCKHPERALEQLFYQLRDFL